MLLWVGMLPSFWAAFLLASNASAQRFGPFERPSERRPELPDIEEPEKPPELLLPPVPSPSELEKERLSTGPTLLVSGFAFAGNTVFSDEELSDLLAPYANRRVTSDELQGARDALTRHYIDSGYLNSGAVLMDQEVRDGIIQFRIVEGRVDEIHVAGNKYFRTGYLRRRLALAAKPPLNVRSLEERLQLLQQDDRIRRLQAELRGAARRGEARLNVQVEEERPYRLWLELSNYESPSIGAYRARLGISHENLTGNGDRLRAHFDATEGLYRAFGSYEIPITARDTRLHFWYDWGKSKIEEKPFDELDIKAESRTYGVGVSHPLYRSLHTDFTIGLDGEYRRSKTYLFGEPFSFAPGPEDGVSKVAVLRFYQAWTYRDRAQVVAARSTFSWGLDALGATQNSGQTPDGQFLAWLGQFQWARRLPWWGIETVFRADIQLSSDPLLSLEQYSLGGHDSVRGYRENTIVRDMGGSASLEVRVPLWRAADGRPIVQLAPFVDFGRAHQRRRGRTPHPLNLASAGVGLRFNITQRVHAQVYWGEELRDVPEPQDRDLQDTGVHFRIFADVF
jgi:hemolysin activation/secretion protein